MELYQPDSITEISMSWSTANVIFSVGVSPCRISTNPTT
jgi:hypothetical protein